jgi:iron complex transport system substrate-binding protein
VDKVPCRIVTLNQGATEFMFALGLADKMVGTAYLDDYIWPQYATAFAKIPVLASGYPNETTIMSVNPDFLVASYNSAFRQVYSTAKGMKGIFSNATGIAPCAGPGSEYPGVKTTCRPQLHAKGIGTYLFHDYCEDTSLRPSSVTEETVYSEMRILGNVFKVDVEPLITDMKADFDSAAAMVSTSMHGSKLKAVWLDCLTCCTVEKDKEAQLFVGGGLGSPNMLMNEAGLDNAFANKAGNWVCVNESDIIAAAPDVMIIIDASWDPALDKITWLYNHSGFCDTDVVKGARFVQVPFSASTLSPRNGPAALDLAIASLHVRTGSSTAVRESGVSSFNPASFQQHTKGLKCTTDQQKVKYDIITTTTTATTTTAAVTAAQSETVVSGLVQIVNAFWPCVLAWLSACQFSA